MPLFGEKEWGKVLGFEIEEQASGEGIRFKITKAGKDICVGNFSDEDGKFKFDLEGGATCKKLLDMALSNRKIADI